MQFLWADSALFKGVGKYYTSVQVSFLNKEVDYVVDERVECVARLV